MQTSLHTSFATIVCGLAALLLQTTADAKEFIKLAEVDGRYSLVAPNGDPFFPHGVNHISPSGRGEDATRVAKTCRMDAEEQPRNQLGRVLSRVACWSSR